MVVVVCRNTTKIKHRPTLYRRFDNKSAITDYDCNENHVIDWENL